MMPHAFVAMPFGTKPDKDGNPVDFNRVYAELIGPALESAGMRPFRADEEARAGDIRTDMFQELLIADMVVVDLTIDNPNVWYELGVRHALRARGVVLVCGGRATTAFDLYTDRKLRYGLKDGAPDPATLAADREALAAMIRDTMASWQGRKTSPVYALLPHLQEPEWKALRLGAVNEFWSRHDAWAERIRLAQKEGRIGSLLLLADEAPVAAFRAEAWITAGKALLSEQQYPLALEQLEKGLAVEPDHLKGLHAKGICLQRLAAMKAPGHSLDRARSHYRQVLERFPDDPETWALMGRLDKDTWTNIWRRDEFSHLQKLEEAKSEDALLRAAIESYREGYRRNPAHYYSGINALTLMHLHEHLTGDGRFASDMGILPGAVRFAAANESRPDQLYWANATLGDLEVLAGTPESVTAAYKEAIVHNDKNWFALDSARAQLALVRELGFRPAEVDAGMAAFDRALGRLSRPENKWAPRQVILFSGHMVDAPDRPTPRFPPEAVPQVAAAIARTLDELAAGPEDLAYTQGACGGDLLFTRACLDRGVRVVWLQPFPEPDFIHRSVNRCSGDWRAEYFSLRGKLQAPPVSALQELGDPPPGGPDADPYVRCNRWLLYSALAFGIERMRFLCVWNGERGDGPGGTHHMYSEIRSRSARIFQISPTTAQPIS